MRHNNIILHMNARNVTTIQYTKSLSEKSVKFIRSTNNRAIWHKNPHTIKNGNIDSILDPLINNIEYNTKFAINASANLDISVAYHILLSRNVFIRNKAIHIQYPSHRDISFDEKIHQKKNNRRKISNPILKSSKARSNRFGVFSSHSCSIIFHCGTFIFLKILSPANILRTEIFAVCLVGISRFCIIYIPQNTSANKKNDSPNIHSAG